MIDYEKLMSAYEENRIYSLQLEVGDRCNQNCIYCYMNAVPEEKNTLSDELIRNILFDSKRLGITAVEWLGGEPLLRESIFTLMSHAKEIGLKNNIWTGGLPLEDDGTVEKCAYYANDGLISVHVSSIDPDTYTSLHHDQSAGDLSVILRGVKKLLETGYPASRMLNSVTFTGRQSADDMIRTIDYFEKEYGIYTSLNVYHTYLRPDMSADGFDDFIPRPKEVIKVYRRYSKQLGRKILPMNCVNKQYCSATMAVLSDGSVTPCATIRPIDALVIHKDGSLYEIFQRNRDLLTFNKFRTGKLSEGCKKCILSDECWGCRSRSYAAGNGIYGKDPRCFRTGDM